MRPYIMLPCPLYDLVQCFPVGQLSTKVALRQFYQQRPYRLLNCFEIIESQQTVCLSYQDAVQSMQPLIGFLFVDFQVAFWMKSDIRSSSALRPDAQGNLLTHRPTGHKDGCIFPQQG